MTVPLPEPYLPRGSVGELAEAVQRNLDALAMRYPIRPEDLAIASPGGPPTGPAGGSLTGTYPNPSVAALVITNAMISASAAIDQSKVSGLVSDLAGKAAMVHTHSQSDITGLVAALALLAPLASPAFTGNPTGPTQSAGNNSTRLATTAYADGAVSTASTADRNRANHTGTQLASTISNFDTQVRTSRLDQMAAPSANVLMNTRKLTGLTPGTASGDSVEYSQMVAGDVAAQLGLTSKPSVFAAPVSALPANTRTGDVLDANANGFLSSVFGSLQFSWKSGSAGSGNGQFNHPCDIAIDGSGNVWVADAENLRVQKFNSAGVYQSQFSTNAGGKPLGLAIDGSGNVWTVEYKTGLNYLAKYNSSGVFQAQYLLNGTIARTMGGIAIDSSGNIFVTAANWNLYPSENHHVQKFNSSGVYQSSFGSFGTGNGQFKSPTAIAIDGSNNIFVVDTGNNRVQKFNSSGTYQSQFGTSGSGDGQFLVPNGIDFDSSGNIWVTDAFNHRIQRFSSAGSYQTQTGGFGSGNGQFSTPGGIDVDGSDNLFVVDQYNNRIQKLSPFTFPATPFDVLINRESGLGAADVKNGIYTVTNVGSGSTKWSMTRRADAAGTYLKNNTFVIAQREGSTSNRAFILTTADPITANTTAIAWDRFEPGGPPSPHVSNHQPGSIDPLPTDVPVAVGATNAEGTATSFARSDHVHQEQPTGAFRAYRAAALNCTGTTTPIVFDTESFDTSNWYDTSTGRYTPQIAGYYHFTVFAGIAAMSSSGNYFQLYLWKNGGGASQLFLCQHAGYPNYPRGGGSDIIYLNGSGDYVQITGFQSSGSNKAYDTGADNTYFTGHRVG